MPAKEKKSRHCHSEGHNNCCFNKSGSRILTGGADGDVHVWTVQGFEDEDPESYRSGEFVSALTASDSKFYVASDENSVKSYNLSDGSLDGTVVRFTGSVTHMCFNGSADRLYACASDFHIKVVDLETNTQKLFQEHEAPVLSLAVQPQETYLASSSCDGTVKIWKTETQNVVKTLNILSKSNDFSASSTLCRMAWTKDGKHLAIPVEQEVRVYNSETWDVAFSLKESRIKELVSIATFSPCGKYLAASCRDGHIFVWDLKNKTCLNTDKPDSKATVTGLEWNPNGSLDLVCIDAEGIVNTFEGMVQQSYSIKIDSDVALADQYADLFDDGDDDDMIAATCDTENKIESAQQSSTTKIPDNDSDDDADNDGFGTTQKKTQRNRIMVDDDESRDTNISALTNHQNDIDEVDKILEGNSAPVPEEKPAPQIIYKGIQPTPLQDPFQPGSTPEHLSHRFMVWNSIGLIRQYNTEEENSIDIEFHDTSTHHAMHVTNTMNHTMADLSAQAAVLACESDSDSPSKLVCMHFSCWDSVKEWSVSMPDGEDILAVTIGEGWIAVCTDLRLVRLYTVGGVQKEIFSIPGPVVCMAANGSQLMVVYHSATGLPGEQCMSVQVLKVTGPKRKCLVNGDRISLSRKAHLSWLGFSAEGTPFYVDTAGIVYMLNRNFANTWVQVADTRKHCKGKSDTQFVVGIHENPTQLRVIPCKGSRYPPTLPRPAVHILQFELPLCDISTEKGKMEDTYWQRVIFSGHLDHLAAEGYDVDDSARSQALMPQQEMLMKMFALSCKMEHEFRACEIAEMMPSQHAVQLAIKYASRLRMLQLAQQLNEVARTKAEEELEVEDEEEVHIVPRTRRPVAATAAPKQEDSDNDDENMEEDGEANQSADIYEELDEEENGDDQNSSAGPMFMMKSKEKKEVSHKPLSQIGQKKNPFRLGSQVTPKAAQGTSVFDSMQRSSASKMKSPAASEPKLKPKPIRLKKSGSSQPTLMGSKKASKENVGQEEPAVTETPSKTGLQLWYEEAKSELSEEHPEMSEEDLFTEGMQRFRQLPKDDRQTWLDKAKSLSSESEKKRKRSDNEGTDKVVERKESESAAKKKKPLSQTTNSKLSAFAFTKS